MILQKKTNYTVVLMNTRVCRNLKTDKRTPCQHWELPVGVAASTALPEDQRG